MQLCIEKGVKLSVRTPNGVEEKSYEHIFVLHGTTFADREIPKGAGFRWEPTRKIWWTPIEGNARQLAEYATNGLCKRWGLEEAEEVVVIGTPQQEAFWDTVVDGFCHIVLEARAGSGKSFSICEAAKRAKEKRIGFSAFNKHIADELQGKIPPTAKAFTLHSLGFSALRRSIEGVRVEDRKADLILDELFPESHKTFRHVVKQLASLCKSYLMDGTDTDQLDAIATRHDVDVSVPDGYEIDYDEYQAKIANAVVRVLEQMKARSQMIDMDDMIWLPVVLNIPVETFDLLFIDEAQDMNLCQQRLSFMACPKGRIVIVGDPKQAIYAFRGADTKSMERMGKQLEETERGVTVLPLTFTRRCPKAHVKLAQSIVPDLEAMPEAIEGEIENINLLQIAAFAQPKDMIICRTNAPLVKTAYDLLRAGKKVSMKGRDIGASIREMLKKLDANTIPELAKALHDYADAEMARLAKLEKSDAIIRLEDRVATLDVLMEGCKSIDELEGRLSELFDGKDDADSIVLSSVHSCKGLEAETVFVLKPDLMPHPKATHPEDKEQEKNIKYVAFTRAKQKLVLAHEHWAMKPVQTTQADWQSEVNDLLRTAYERVPFDQLEVLKSIEQAMQGVRPLS